MTHYLSFRSRMTAGTVIDPKLFTGEAGSEDLTEVPKGPKLNYRDLFRNKEVLFVTHGFNVNAKKGINALGRFDQRLHVTGAEFCVAVLWPGDWWIPAINYPVEAGDAVDCGQRLAKFCKDNLSEANSISFVSHSLGARVFLEAVKRLDGRARVLCMAAAAMDDNCLLKQYVVPVGKTDRIVNLASKKDWVLHYAYPAGDAVSDAFGDDDSPFVGALGRYGPRTPRAPNVTGYEIPERLDYGHGSYLPPSDKNPAADDIAWQDATDFMIRAYRKQDQDWPPEQ
jgi:esterase/lipase superfamily enzyme